MLCNHCKTEAAETAKFCSNCGKPMAKPGKSPLTDAAGIHVKQEVETVQGTVTGLAAGKGALPDDVKAEVGQTIDTVETGGIVTGAVLGGEEGNVHVGGQQQYGDTVQGDKRTVSIGGGPYVEGNVNTGRDFVGRDKRTTYRTAFDQRGQTVHGAQTNIEGGVQTSGGIFNSGVMNTGAAPAPVSLLGELRRLLTSVAQAGQQEMLDEEQVIDVESALRKALIQAEKATPNVDLIIGHLTKAQAIVAEVAAARGLAVSIGNLLQMVGRRG